MSDAIAKILGSRLLLLLDVMQAVRTFKVDLAGWNEPEKNNPRGLDMGSIMALLKGRCEFTAKAFAAYRAHPDILMPEMMHVRRWLRENIEVLGALELTNPVPIWDSKQFLTAQRIIDEIGDSLEGEGRLVGEAALAAAGEIDQLRVRSAQWHSHGRLVSFIASGELIEDDFKADL